MAHRHGEEKTDTLSDGLTRDDINPDPESSVVPAPLSESNEIPRASSMERITSGMIELNDLHEQM